MNNRPYHVNLSSASSDFFQVYPSVPAEIDLVEAVPENNNKCPRVLRVMGAITEGSTEVLCVKRRDDVEVAIPIPYSVVGYALELAPASLLPYTVSTPVRSADDETDPQVTISGTPDEWRDFTITITDPGDGEDPDSIVFSWEADGTGAPSQTGQSPTSGSFALGSTGLTATFPVGIYTDNSTFDFSSFVTTVTNILVEW